MSIQNSDIDSKCEILSSVADLVVQILPNNDYDSIDHHDGGCVNGTCNGQVVRTAENDLTEENDAFEDTNLGEHLLSNSDGDNSDDDGLSGTKQPKFDEQLEPTWQIALQVFFPYIIAGFGMVGAGTVLDIVKVSFYQQSYELLSLHGTRH